MGKPEIMFSRSPDGLTKALRQGEILRNVVELRIDSESIRSVDDDSQYDIDPVKHPFAIVVSQDCDLEQDFNYRFFAKGNPRNELPSVLLCQAENVDEFTESDEYRTLFTSSTFKGNFVNNDVFRYHFIQGIAATLSADNDSLPELGIDFKKYFSIPTVEVYRRIELAHTIRTTLLQTPYREHFCNRFFNFNNRIALPEEYESN